MANDGEPVEFRVHYLVQVDNKGLGVFVDDLVEADENRKLHTAMQQLKGLLE